MYREFWSFVNTINFNVTRFFTRKNFYEAGKITLEMASYIVPVEHQICCLYCQLLIFISWHSMFLLLMWNTLYFVVVEFEERHLILSMFFVTKSVKNITG